MSIEVRWADAQQSVCEIVLQQSWTWDDFREASSQAISLLRAVDHPVYLIFDYSGGQDVPAGGNAFAYTTQTITQLPSHVEMIVAISTNLFVKMMFDSFRRVLTTRFSRRIYTAHTSEEAFRRIERNITQHQPLS